MAAVVVRQHELYSVSSEQQYILHRTWNQQNIFVLFYYSIFIFSVKSDVYTMENILFSQFSRKLILAYTMVLRIKKTTVNLSDLHIAWCRSIAEAHIGGEGGC